MKTCSICKTEKNEFDFNKDKSTVDKLTRSCKDCQKEYREKNKDRIRKYNEDNKESKYEYNKKYRIKNKSEIVSYRKTHRKSNKKRLNEKSKKYREDNRDYIKEYNKEYREKNKDKFKEYYLNNKDKILSNQKIYEKNKRKTDPLFKFIKNIRVSISNSIRKNGYTRKSKTHEILGCSFEDFKIFIESKFSDEMTWENYGEWHIDHIEPISWAKSEEEILKLNHYTNLQPMWGNINQSKGNRYKG